MGALLLVAPTARLEPVDYGLILAMTAAGHIAVNHIAYALGVRDTRW
jgi:hypothetical protein